jgi:hypothetical protein
LLHFIYDPTSIVVFADAGLIWLNSKQIFQLDIFPPD